jgi:hypothetical protein
MAGTVSRFNTAVEMFRRSWITPVAAIYGTICAWDVAQSQFVPEHLSTKLAKFHQVVGLTGYLSLSTWLIIGAAIVAAAAVEYAHRRRRQYENRGKKISNLSNTKYLSIIASLLTIVALLGTSFYRLASTPILDTPAVKNTFPPWVPFALNEVGVNDKDSFAKIIEYFSAIQANTQEFFESKDGKKEITENWSSAFVEWSLNKANIVGPKKIDVVLWGGWGRVVWDSVKNPDAEPEFGCIMTLSFPSDARHIGFFLAGSRSNFVILGGDQSGFVSVRKYSRKLATSCRMPPS